MEADEQARAPRGMSCGTLALPAPGGAEKGKVHWVRKFGARHRLGHRHPQRAGWPPPISARAALRSAPRRGARPATHRPASDDTESCRRAGHRDERRSRHRTERGTRTPCSDLRSQPALLHRDEEGKCPLPSQRARFYREKRQCLSDTTEGRSVWMRRHRQSPNQVGPPVADPAKWAPARVAWMGWNS